MAIVGWATAELVGTDSCTVRNRMSVGTVEARQESRWRSRIRVWGSGEPATDNPAAWDVERATLAYSRWAGIHSRKIVVIGSHSFALLHDRMPVGNFTRWGQRRLER